MVDFGKGAGTTGGATVTVVGKSSTPTFSGASPISAPSAPSPAPQPAPQPYAAVPLSEQNKGLPAPSEVYIGATPEGKIGLFSQATGQSLGGITAGEITQSQVLGGGALTTQIGETKTSLSQPSPSITSSREIDITKEYINPLTKETLTGAQAKALLEAQELKILQSQQEAEKQKAEFKASVEKSKEEILFGGKMPIGSILLTDTEVSKGLRRLPFNFTPQQEIAVQLALERGQAVQRIDIGNERNIQILDPKFAEKVQQTIQNLTIEKTDTPQQVQAKQEAIKELSLALKPSGQEEADKLKEYQEAKARLSAPTISGERFELLPQNLLPSAKAEQKKKDREIIKNYDLEQADKKYGKPFLSREQYYSKNIGDLKQGKIPEFESQTEKTAFEYNYQLNKAIKEHPASIGFKVAENVAAFALLEVVTAGLGPVAEGAGIAASTAKNLLTAGGITLAGLFAGQQLQKISSITKLPSYQQPKAFAEYTAYEGLPIVAGGLIEQTGSQFLQKRAKINELIEPLAEKYPDIPKSELKTIIKNAPNVLTQEIQQSFIEKAVSPEFREPAQKLVQELYEPAKKVEIFNEPYTLTGKGDLIQAPTTARQQTNLIFIGKIGEQPVLVKTKGQLSASDLNAYFEGKEANISGYGSAEVFNLYFKGAEKSNKIDIGKKLQDLDIAEALAEKSFFFPKTQGEYIRRQKARLLGLEYNPKANLPAIETAIELERAGIIKIRRNRLPKDILGQTEVSGEQPYKLEINPIAINKRTYPELLERREFKGTAIEKNLLSAIFKHELLHHRYFRTEHGAFEDVLKDIVTKHEMTKPLTYADIFNIIYRSPNREYLMRYPNFIRAIKASYYETIGRNRKLETKIKAIPEFYELVTSYLSEYPYQKAITSPTAERFKSFDILIGKEAPEANIQSQPLIIPTGIKIQSEFFGKGRLAEGGAERALQAKTAITKEGKVLGATETLYKLKTTGEEGLKGTTEIGLKLAEVPKAELEKIGKFSQYQLVQEKGKTFLKKTAEKQLPPQLIEELAPLLYRKVEYKKPEVTSITKGKIKEGEEITLFEEAPKPKEVLRAKRPEYEVFEKIEPVQAETTARKIEIAEAGVTFKKQPKLKEFDLAEYEKELEAKSAKIKEHEELNKELKGFKKQLKPSKQNRFAEKGFFDVEKVIPEQLTKMTDLVQYVMKTQQKQKATGLVQLPSMASEIKAGIEKAAELRKKTITTQRGEILAMRASLQPQTKIPIERPPSSTTKQILKPITAQQPIQKQAVQPKIIPEIKTEIKPEVIPKIIPEIKTELKQEIKTELKPIITTELKTGLKTTIVPPLEFLPSTGPPPPLPISTPQPQQPPQRAIRRGITLSRETKYTPTLSGIIQFESGGKFLKIAKYTGKSKFTGFETREVQLPDIAPSQRARVLRERRLRMKGELII